MPYVFRMKGKILRDDFSTHSFCVGWKSLQIEMKILAKFKQLFPSLHEDIHSSEAKCNGNTSETIEHEFLFEEKFRNIINSTVSSYERQKICLNYHPGEVKWN